MRHRLVNIVVIAFLGAFADLPVSIAQEAGTIREQTLLEAQPPDAAQRIDTARQLIRDDRLGEAEVVLRALLIEVPGNPQAHFWLGRVFMNRRDFGQGLAHIEESVALEPNRPSLKQALGRAYEEAGRSRDAERVYREVIEQAKEESVAQEAERRLSLLLGRRRAERGDETAARAEFRELLKITARGYEKQGDWLEAEKIYDEVLRVAPDDVDTHIRLARVYDARGDQERLHEKLRDVIRRFPTVDVRNRVQEFLGHKEGIRLFQDNRLDEALAVFTRILTIFPNDASANLYSGMIYYRQHWMAQAEKAFEKVLAADPAHLDARLQLGRVYEDTNRDGQAIAAFESIIAGGGQTPQAVEAQARLDKLFRQRSQDIARALEPATRAEIVGPKTAAELPAETPKARFQRDVAAVIEQGRELLRLGKLNEAQNIFETLVTQLPGDPQGHYWLGQVYLARRQQGAGLGSIERSVELAPDNMKLRFALGIAYEDAGQLDKALENYELILEHTRDKELLTEIERRRGSVRARISLEQGDTDAALQEYDALRRRYPEDLRVLETLGNAYESSGRTAQADAAFTELLARTPTDAMVRMRLVEIYKKRGDSGRAATLLKQVVTLDRDGPAGRAALGQLGLDDAHRLMDQQRLDEALAALQRVLAVAPNNPIANMNAGVIYHSQGRLPEAQDAYEKALAQDSENPELLFRLGRLYEERQMVDEALDTFARLISVGAGTSQARDAAARLPKLREAQSRRLTAIRIASEEDIKQAVERGVSFFNAGKLAEAQPLFEAVVQQAPENPQGYYWLGQIQMLRAEHERGVANLEKSRALAPENVVLRNELAKAYEKAGRLADAERAFEGLTRQTANQDLARTAQQHYHLVRAKRYVRDGDRDAALGEYRGLRDRYPDDQVVLEEIAFSYEQLGESSEADALIAELLRIAPGNMALHLRLATLYENRGARDAALEHLTHVLDHVPRGALRQTALQHLGLNQGQQLLEQNKPAQAVAVFERILALVPDDPSVNLYAGLAYHAQKDLPKAEAAYKKALAGEPNAVSIILRLAQVYQDMEMTAEAVSYYTKAAALGTGTPQGEQARDKLSQLTKETLTRGRGFLERGELDRAQKIFEDILERDPDNAQAHYWLAQVYSKRADFGDMAQSLERSVALAPENTALRVALGKAYLDAGLHRQAEQTLGEVLRRESFNVAAQLLLAELYETRGEHDRSMAQLARVLELDLPAEARGDVLNRLGVGRGTALMREGKLDEALELFERILVFAPAEPQVLVNIGRIHQRRGDPARAIAAFQKVVTLDPSDGETQLTIAELHMRLGGEADALAIYEQMVEEAPGTKAGQAAARKLQEIYGSQVTDLLARLAAAKGDRSAVIRHTIEQGKEFLRKPTGVEWARRLLQAVVERDPGNAEGYRWLGQAYLASDKQVDALVLLRKSVELEPGRAEFHAGLADAYRRSGRYDQALLEYDRALELDPGNAAFALSRLGVHEEQGDYERLLAEIPAFLRQRPPEAEVRRALDLLGLKRADELFRQGRFDEALVEYQRVLAAAPDEPDANLRAGEIHQRQGRLIMAEASYAQVLAVEPDNLDARLRLGRLHAERGQPDQAIAELEAVVAAGRRTAHAAQATAALKPIYKMKSDGLRDEVKVLSGREDARFQGLVDRAVALFGKADPQDLAAVFAGLASKAPEDPQPPYWLGQLYLAQHDYPQAIAHIERSRERAPANALLQHALGKAYAEAGMFDRAMAVFYEVWQRADDVALATDAHRRYGLLRGDKLSRQGDAQGAVVAYEELRTAFPQDSTVLEQLGRAYERAGRHDDADRVFNEILSLAPDASGEFRLRLASIYEERGDGRRAVAQLMKAVELDPAGPVHNQALDRLGLAKVRALVRENKRDEALALLDRMRSAFPHDAQILFYSARIYRALGRLVEAEQAYLAALELDPNFDQARFELAQLYEKTLRDGKAIPAYEDIVTRARDSDIGNKAFERLGDLYTKRAVRLNGEGKLLAVADDYRKIIENNPESQLTHFNLGAVYIQMGREDDALAEFKESIRIEPNSPAAYLQVAQIYDRKHHPADAIEAYAYAISLLDNEDATARAVRRLRSALFSKLMNEERPVAALNELESLRTQGLGDQNTYYTLGVTYREQGNLERAIEVLREGVHVYPDSLALRYDLAILYERMDEDGLALTQYREILKQGSPGDRYVETVRRRITSVEDRLARFTSNLNYQMSAGETVVVQNDQEKLSGSFASTTDYALRTLFRPQKNVVLSVTPGFSYNTNHGTESDSMAPRLSLNVNVNHPDAFYGAYSSYAESYNLMLDTFQGSSFGLGTYGGVRVKNPFDFLEALFKKQKEEEPRPPETAAWISAIERAPETAAVRPPGAPAEEPPTRSRENASLAAALRRIFEEMFPEEAFRKKPTIKEEERVTRHVVVKGDTLWGIAAKLLDNPWLWPELWQVNPEIENPHLIYPGDVVSLLFIGERPVLVVRRAADKEVILPEAARLTPEERRLRNAQITEHVDERLAEYRQAVELMQQNRLEQALDVFQRILSVVPDDPLTNLNVGIIYQRQNNWAGAEAAYRKVLQKDRTNIEALLGLGEIYARTNRAARAEELFEYVISLGPGTPEARRAEELIESLHAERAEGLARRPLVTEFELEQIVESAQRLLEEGDLERAQTILERVIERAPENAQAYQLLGRIHLERGDDAAAFDQFERSAALAPGDMDYKLVLGRIAEKTGRYAVAEQAFSAVLEHGTVETQVHEAERGLRIVRGKRFASQGEYRAAIEEYQQVLDKSPDDAAVLALVAEAYALQGDTARAIQIYEAAVAVTPGDPEPRMRLFELYQRSGARERAEEQLAQAYALAADDEAREGILRRWGLFEEGLNLLRQHKIEEARAVFERVLAVAPDSTLAQLNLAVIYQEQKEYAKAEAIYKQVLEKDPQNLTARLRLGMLHVAANRSNEAIEAFEKAAFQGRGTPAGEEARAWLDYQEAARVSALSREKIQAAEPQAKTIQVQLSYSDPVPPTTTINDTRNYSLNLSYNSPSVRFGNWNISYTFGVQENEHPLGTDYAYTSQELRFGYNRPIPWIPRLAGNVSIARLVFDFTNSDTNARYGLGIVERRETTRDTLTIGVNYTLHSDLSLNASLTQTATSSSLPLGFVYNTSGVPIAYQGSILGQEFSALSLGLGLAFRF